MSTDQNGFSGKGPSGDKGFTVPSPHRFQVLAASDPRRILIHGTALLLFAILITILMPGEWAAAAFAPCMLYYGIVVEFRRAMAIAVGVWLVSALCLLAVDIVAERTNLVLGLVMLLGVGGGASMAGELFRLRATIGALERMRLEAEREAAIIVDSSPAAILTVSETGVVLRANAAADRLFGMSSGRLEGRPVEKLLPIIQRVLRSRGASTAIRTMVESRGYRPEGEPFFAQVWLNSYHTEAGLRLAAIISDASEQVRDREEAGLRQLLTNSRILAGAVSHEVRNLAAAASTVVASLKQTSGGSAPPELGTLEQVLEQLRRLTTPNLEPAGAKGLGGVDTKELLDDLRIVVAPMFAERDTSLVFEIAPNLPRVLGDQQAFLQVFLNLTRNALRALEGVKDGELRISAYTLEGNVVVRFYNNGPAVTEPGRLFRPFSSESNSAGLGLFISRSIVRTSGGELHHVPMISGACFLVEMPFESGQSVEVKQ